MAINTTIIPQKIDLSKEVDTFTIEYKPLASGGTDNKLQTATEFMSLIAEHNLRITSLEVNAGISGADGEIADIFTTATGLRNTIDTTNTTCLYSVANHNYDNSLVSTNIGTKSINYSGSSLWVYDSSTTLKLTPANASIQIIPTGIPVSFDKAGESFTLSTPSSGQIYSYTSTGTEEDIVSISLSDYSALPKFNEEITISYSRVYDGIKNLVITQNEYFSVSGGTTGSSSSYPMGIVGAKGRFDAIINELEPSQTPVLKYIYINYTLQKPKACYLALYSDSFTATDIGDVTYYFTDGTNTSAEYQAWEVVNQLQLGFTPTKVVIKQNDTAISKITKYVLLLGW